MTFYAGMATTAYDLLTQFGQTVTIRTKVTEEYDLESGDVEQCETSETGIGVLLPAGQPEALIDADPARVIDTAIWVLAASGLATIPVPGSVIDGDGASWAVIGMTPISPAGVPLIYKLLVKKTGAA